MESKIDIKELNKELKLLGGTVDKNAGVWHILREIGWLREQKEEKEFSKLMKEKGNNYFISCDENYDYSEFYDDGELSTENISKRYKFLDNFTDDDLEDLYNLTDFYYIDDIDNLEQEYGFEEGLDTFCCVPHPAMSDIYNYHKDQNGKWCIYCVIYKYDELVW